MIHTKETGYKMHCWQEMQTRVMQMRDKLDKGVDAGIVETVIVLNLLDISTVMSCEGHLQGASGAPWIDIEDREATEKEQYITRLFAEAREAYAQGTVSEHLFNQAHQARLEVLGKQLVLRYALMRYLIAFYEHRSASYDVRLVIQARAGGRSRLESQGAGFQEVLGEQERAYNLRRYQEEMHAFTEFLEDQYFLEERIWQIPRNMDILGTPFTR